LYYNREIVAAFNSKNITKAWITSGLGVLIAGFTAYHASKGTIPWVWEGLSGCAVGLILLLAPDSFRDIVKGVMLFFTKSKE
jgi:hypothetical protein